MKKIILILTILCAGLVFTLAQLDGSTNEEYMYWSNFLGTVFTGSPSITLGASGGNSGQIDFISNTNDLGNVSITDDDQIKVSGSTFWVSQTGSQTTAQFQRPNNNKSSINIANSEGSFLISADGGNAYIESVDGILIIEPTITQFDSLKVHRERSWVADDDEIVLATGVAGFGQAMIGDNQEWGHFRFTSAGAVTLIANSGNVVNTDTDAKFCIYDAGTGIAVKNRLGSALTVMIDISYADPTP